MFFYGYRVTQAVFCWFFSFILLGYYETSEGADQSVYRLATFTADVTIPLNHRCMGVLPTKSKVIIDPLEAIGFVLTGADKPIVYVALDWCEVRNGAYDQWRDALAIAAETTRERVLVSSLHQHDAPVSDADAGELLKSVGLSGELYDEDFHQESINRVAAALKKSLKVTVPVSHIGIGQAKVEGVASNRRIVLENGEVRFSRGSRSGGDEFMSQAPDGLIDPYLKTLSFWNREQPLLALHSYATHPMSYYGQGEVSADFVGLARRQMQNELPDVVQIYASGCSGDVTAGKYNNGSQADRVQLAKRLYVGMKQSWKATKKHPLDQIGFRHAPLLLDYYDHAELKRNHLKSVLSNQELRTENRILAAMSLASLNRVESGQAIDFPCVDLGHAQIVLFPGESFVGYQLMAQQLRPDSFVLSIGYGECWPGYVPTNSAFADGFHDKWLWVGPGAENRIRAALRKILLP